VIVFIRTLPLTLALVALLAFPHFLRGTAEDAATLLGLADHLQSLVEGDTEALETIGSTAFEFTTLRRHTPPDSAWVPLVGQGTGLRQGDLELAEMLRSIELPMDAHLSRQSAR
jgi:hypothetical protein